MTWKFAQARPTGFSLGRKLRLQQLSLARGVISFSDGNTHASAQVSSDTARQSLMEMSNPSERAACRVPAATLVPSSARRLIVEAWVRLRSPGCCAALRLVHLIGRHLRFKLFQFLKALLCPVL